MSIDYSGLALPKPEPRRRVKGRRQRQETTVKRLVRELTVARDGHCLIASRLPKGLRDLLGPCAGPSEWAHIGRQRRCFTRGQVATDRHTTAGTAQLCRAHHQAYDAHQFDVTTGAEGMDGMIGIMRRGA